MRLGPTGRRNEVGSKRDLIPSYINEHHRQSYRSTIRSSSPEAGRITDNSNSQATKIALASPELPTKLRGWVELIMGVVGGLTLWDECIMLG